MKTKVFLFAIAICFAIAMLSSCKYYEDYDNINNYGVADSTNQGTKSTDDNGGTSTDDNNNDGYGGGNTNGGVPENGGGGNRPDSGNTNSSNKNDSTVSLDTILIKIPAVDLYKTLVYRRLQTETSESKATFKSSLPDTLRELSILHFDATNPDETTISFPTRIPSHKIEGVIYPTIKTKGQFGADRDRSREILSLNIDFYDHTSEIISIGTSIEGGIDYRKLTGEFYLSGFKAGDGNNSEYATGRTLIGTDGEDVYIFHLKCSTSPDAEQSFERFGVCPPPYIEIGGGTSSNGKKPSPIFTRINSFYCKVLR